MKLFRKELKVQIYAIRFVNKNGDSYIGQEAAYTLEEAIKKMEKEHGKGPVDIKGHCSIDLEDTIDEYTEEVVALKKLKS